MMIHKSLSLSKLWHFQGTQLNIIIIIIMIIILVIIIIIVVWPRLKMRLAMVSIHI